MTYVVAHLAETHDPTERKRLKAAMAQYVSSRGLPEPNFIAEGLAQVISTSLQRGDVLLLPSLSSLGATPSQQESLLSQAQGAGVSVHLLSLMSPVEQHLPGIREGWQASAQLESELERMSERMAKRELEFQEEMQNFQDEVFARATAAFGSKQLVSKIKDEQSPIGTFIRQRREQLGLSQAQLAEMVGTSRSSIQRAEVDGASDSLTAILAALTDNTKGLEKQDVIS
jgi:DNA-binding XRE family transcriptional regulator